MPICLVRNIAATNKTATILLFMLAATFANMERHVGLCPQGNKFQQIL
jgi:hypothetical protein